MITRKQILSLMPPASGKNTVNYSIVKNSNIIKVIHNNAQKAAEITKPIAPLFKGKTDIETCKNIYEFLRREIRYIKDGDAQDIKLPNRFILDGTGDCKSYSLFANSILKNLNIPAGFRYVSYSKNDPTPQHVYNFAINGTSQPGQVIILDGVWSEFNKQKKFTYKKDFMPIRTLSGTDQEIGKLNLKKAAEKLQQKIKDTAVVKKAAEVQNQVKNTAVVKKAAQVQSQVKNTTVVKAGSQLQNQIKRDVAAGKAQVIKVAKKGAEVLKDVPQGAKVVLGAPGRRAFRTLVALNFHSYATKLNADRENVFKIWKSLGGIREELEQSIKAGLARRPIFGIGCLDCEIQNKNINGASIGDPVTIAAALAAAAPVIAVFSGILKEALSVVKAAKDTFKKQEAAAPASNDQVMKDPNNSGQVVTQTDKPGSNFTQTDTGNQYAAPDATNKYFAPDPFSYVGPPGQAPETEKKAPEDTPKPETEKKDSAAGLVAAAIIAKILFF